MKVKLSWVNLFRKEKNLYVYRNKLAKTNKYKLYALFVQDAFSISHKYAGRINLHNVTIAKDFLGYKIIFKILRGKK